MSKLSFLIVSDLHSSVSDEHRDDSRLIFNEKTQTSEHANAFIGFVKGLEKQFNYLICPGDISNKGDVKGFKAGWHFLNDIKDELNIENLLCVPGNHDHQSRPGTCFSAIHEIKFISPPFPTIDSNINTHFWGWHWSHLDFSHFNVIKLNSSAYHGLNDEYKHGRVAIETANQISSYLRSDGFKEKSFNLLLCHHHPIKMEHVDEDFDTEVMEGGQLLLKELDKANVGPWLVIHGHKHFASLGYGMTERSTPPLIFSAGSLGANLYPQIQDKTSNQFYILEIDLEKTDEEECLVGSFEAYSWNLMHGWHPSKSDNLPHRGGFGSSTKPITILRKIKALLENTPYIDKNDLKTVQQEIEFYTPGQFRELLEKMQKVNLKFEVDGNQILEVAK